MNEKYEQLIADYLTGNLDQAGKDRVEKLIASSEIDFMEFRELEKLHDDLGTLPVPKPGTEMSANFYAMLENEKQAQKKPFTEKLKMLTKQWLHEITLPRVAYTTILLLIGGWGGAQLSGNQPELEQLSNEVQNMREMLMVNMLEGPSAAERLKAVNISSELPSADTEAIHALLFTLNNDPSVNVRVQTIEALKRWGNDERVRKGLVESIAGQQSAIVIIQLADAMIELELKNSAPELERLLEERELDYTVQQKLQSSIAVLM
jgi:hypothetical protein